jgi:hypothetical protein
MLIYLPSNIITLKVLDKIIPGLGIVFINIFILIVYNFIMYFIYKGKYPFFEKYRVNNVSYLFKI